MLDMLPPFSDGLQNWKIGEVYLPSVNNYRVQCCVCKEQIAFEQFQPHFQNQHFNREYLIFPQIQVKEEQRDEVDAVSTGKVAQDMLQDEKLIELAEIKQGADEYDAIAIDAVPPVETVEATSIAEQNFIDLAEMKSNEKVVVMDAPMVDVDDNSIDSVFSTNDDAAVLSDDDTDDNEKDHANLNPICSEDLEDTAKTAFNCTHCNRNYITKAKLKRHIYKCHNPKNPERAKGTFPCIVCNRIYETKLQLSRHKYKYHKGKEPKVIETHTCTACDKVFRSAGALELHQYSAHTGLSCEICGKSYTNVYSLRYHKESHNSEKKYKCDQCEESYASERQLRTHARRHTNDWCHMCELCGKRCFQAALLKAHMLRHTGERPAKCDVCGKGFFNNYYLKQHAVKHSNERPFKCDLCNETFALRRTLGVHKRKHSTKPLTHVCQMCGKAFAEAKGLTSHMRSHDLAKHNVTLLTKIA